MEEDQHQVAVEDSHLSSLDQEGQEGQDHLSGEDQHLQIEEDQHLQIEEDLLLQGQHLQDHLSEEDQHLQIEEDLLLQGQHPIGQDQILHVHQVHLSEDCHLRIHLLDLLLLNQADHLADKFLVKTKRKKVF